MDNFGLLTLIPPVVIIVFALATKRTFEALLLGAVIGFFMTDKWNVLGATLDGFSVTAADNMWTVSYTHLDVYKRQGYRRCCYVR